MRTLPVAFRGSSSSSSSCSGIFCRITPRDWAMDRSTPTGYDPRPTLAKVKCPILALNGSKDGQVPPDAVGELLILALHLARVSGAR